MMSATTKSLRLLSSIHSSFTPLSSSFSSSPPPTVRYSILRPNQLPIQTPPSSSFSSSPPPPVRYSILRPHQLPIVQRLLYQSFHRDEPMTRHLGLNQGAFSIPDSDGMAEDLVINHNISLIALDPATNTPLGIILNGEFHKSELEVSREEVVKGCIDPAFAPIAAILHECQQRGRDQFKAMDTDVLFDLKMVATAPEARGMGLATDLLRRSVLLAKCLGYKGVKSEATGTYSRKAIAKCGLDVVDVVRYDEFAMDGKKVLEGIEGHEGCTYMMAKF